MSFSTLDVIIFLGYFVVVGAVAVVASRRERVAADYFLAGRNLPWWLIGISLIASNISTEHFVGMAGSGVDFGLAIASYEWMAAITLVIVARWFLPKFLAQGISTMPEYLENRFDVRSRSWLAIYMILAYVFVAMATVLYSGGLALQTIFDLPLGWGITILAVFAGAYTAYGGLKAVVWSDLIQGTMLVLGGVVVTVLGLRAIGGWDVLMAEAGDKFHTVLPLDHPELPWFAVFFGGLWIANLFYWGCNQFITQRTLAARDVRQGRYGIVFAAYLKLLIPLIVVIPGVIAWVLYADEMTRSDMAYPLLLQRLLPSGLFGLMFAALLAAIMSHAARQLTAAPDRGGPEQHRGVSRDRQLVGALPAPLRAGVQLHPGVLGTDHPRRGRGLSGRALLAAGVGRGGRGGCVRDGGHTAGHHRDQATATGYSVPGSDVVGRTGADWIARRVVVGRSAGDRHGGLRARGGSWQPGRGGSDGGEGATGGLSERDRLFDVLCLGVVVLTVGLYVVFF
jgi:SSS family transporter